MSATFIQVAAAVIRDDDRYLVTRRKAGTHLGGMWEFPGGKREPGESLEDCLRRELREELEIEITPPRPFKILCHAYPEKTVELHFFRCAIADGRPRPVGCDEIRWATTAELQTLQFPPADLTLIETMVNADGKGFRLSE
jgi:mutator protein MutT